MCHVGIALSSYRQPAWIARAMKELLRMEHVRFTVLLLPSMGKKKYAVRCYRWLDRLFFPAKKDAFAEENVRTLVQDLIAENSSEKPDIVINLSASSAEQLLWKEVRVWTFAHLLDPQCGMHELVTNAPILEARLMEEYGGTSRTLYRSYSAVNRLSVNRTLCQACWKAAHFLVRALRQSLSGNLENIQEESPSSTKCSTIHSLIFPFILLWRICKRAAKLACFKEQWVLTIGRRNTAQKFQEQMRECTVAKPPKNRFWADPFPVEHEGNTYVFFEEWNDALGRGTLAVAPVQADGILGEIRPILAGEDHLSYPFIFRWENNFFLMPETRSRRTVELYRAVRFPYEWEHAGVLLRDVEAVDATLHCDGARWWMFVNIAQEGASTFDELHLFSAETPMGPWHPHPQNPVVSDVRFSRPAGRIFEEDGMLLRPAQDCSVRYGRRIVLNRIVELNQTSYREEPVSILEPTWLQSQRGTHTINLTESWIAADALRRMWRWQA